MLLLRWENALHDTQMKPLRHPFFVRYNSGALSSWVQHWCGSVALLWGPKQKHWDPLEEVISISKRFIYGENASPTIRFMLQGWAKCVLHPGMRHSIMDVQSNHTVATEGFPVQITAPSSCTHICCSCSRHIWLTSGVARCYPSSLRADKGCYNIPYYVNSLSVMFFSFRHSRVPAKLKAKLYRNVI